MKTTLATAISLFLLGLSTFAFADTPPEVVTIQAHLQDVEDHLRAVDVSDWPIAKQTARGKTLDILAGYRERGLFPRNIDFPHARVPYFIDDLGTACAVAYLMQETGYSAQADDIATTENNAWVMEMTSSHLGPWTNAAGLTAEEASWIQPTYGFCDMITASVESAPTDSNCGETINLVATPVPELECGANYSWVQTAGEPEATIEILSPTEVQVAFPEVTADGEEYVFTLTVSNQGYTDSMEHTVTVACEGQDPVDPDPVDPDPVDPDPVDPDPTDPDPTTPKQEATCATTSGSSWLPILLLGLFVIARRRRE